MAFLDAAQDRLLAEFNTDVETVRAGTILAHDQRAFERWQRTTQRQPKADGTGLNALVGIAGARIERGGFEFRN